jgi:hypothetical protein
MAPLGVVLIPLSVFALPLRTVTAGTATLPPVDPSGVHGPGITTIEDPAQLDPGLATVLPKAAQRPARLYLLRQGRLK